MSTKEKPAITNTREQDVMDHAAGTAFMGPRYIELLEKRGQDELVAQRELLPAEGLLDARSTWEAMGVAIGEPVPDDPLFVFVTLPEGWRIAPTDHAMWSTLRDAKNRVRARLFYKAAFYDRKAFVSPCCRFRLWEENVDEEGDKRCFRICAIDAFHECSTKEDEPICWRGPWKAYGSFEEENRNRTDNYEAMRQRLGALLPNVEDPSAYWDDDTIDIAALLDAV